MKAAVIEQFGNASVLEVKQVELPEPGPGQILVRVHATNVNPIDWKMREGQMAARYGEEFPMILGWDCSGVVVETGADVTSFAIGDEVIARSDVGTGRCYAEYAVINIATAVRKPEKLSHTEAASLPLTGLTVINSLVHCANLQSGQSILIVGGSGGVGTLAIQIAKTIGAEVTSVSSSKNLELAGSLGADHVIDYESANPLSGNVKYDVIYDTVGAHNLENAKPALKPEGVYVTLVPVPGIDFFIPGQSSREPGAGYFVAWTPAAADLETLTNWVNSGAVQPVIDSVYPLDKISEAHERSETERAVGKIVIEVHTDD